MEREDVGTGHVHSWGEKRYVDFCHYTVVRKICRNCGITNETAVERNFDLNPLQIAFADEGCHRCRALLEGNEPPSWAVRGAA
jgi:hypothetical protein